MTLPCQLLIVGEAWGSEEERRSTACGRPSPFVGKSGWFLRTSLSAAGILPPPFTSHYPGVLGMEKEWDQARAHGVYVTNVFQTRPGQDSNDIESLLGDKRKAALQDLVLDKPPLRPGLHLLTKHKHHLDRLDQEIKSLNPNLVLALGATALWALVDSTEISKNRGAIVARPLAPKLLPTYHPAAIFRRWGLRPAFLADLLKASREMQSPVFDRRDRLISFGPESPEELWEWWHDFGLVEPQLSVDIETEANRWISEVGIAVSETRALHVPLLVRVPTSQASQLTNQTGPDRRALLAKLANHVRVNYHLIPYWEPAEEVQVWLFLQHVLEQTGIVPKPVIGQNFLYDIQYLLRAALVPGGIRVRGFRNDTMLLHHALYPGLEKSLEFMASVYCNEPGWKDIRQKGGKEESEE